MPRKPKIPPLTNPMRAIQNHKPKAGLQKIAKGAASKSVHGRSTGKK